MKHRVTLENPGMTTRWRSGWLLALALCALPMPSSGQVVWTETSSRKYSPRHTEAMAYDSDRDVMVIFGGFPDGGRLLGDTWEWNGANWKKVGSSGPSPRVPCAMAYDSAREVVVLFGGSVGGEAQLADDTWEWDGKGWRQVASGGPSPRCAPMVYDSARGVMVLGDTDTPASDTSDTWEWDGEAWRQVSTAGPPRRGNTAMAYDSRRGVTVLFGGISGSGPANEHRNDTWEWDGNVWLQVASKGPRPRGEHALAYDERRGVTVLFGGATDADAFSDTWEWNGKRWTQVKIEGPSDRQFAAMAYDSARGQIVFTGGLDVEPFRRHNDTWLLGSPIAVAHSDYDGDGRTEPAVFDPVRTRWRVQGQKSFKFGDRNGIPVPGDYNGDGKTDAAYFQAATATWRVRNQFKLEDFGRDGDLPAPADYDGDGTTDVALFRPSEGTWQFVDQAAVAAAIGSGARGTPFSAPLATTELEFGRPGDIPVPGDYDGDGEDEPAVYRPATRQWIVHGGPTIRFGKAGDIPVPADYDGDGKTDIATWRPKTAKWKVRRGDRARLGALGNIPVPADYDGDGASDFGVYDPATGTWLVKDQFEVQHGKPGELPLVQGR